MKREGIERAIEDVLELQGRFYRGARFLPHFGDTALALLRAELARPESDAKTYQEGRESMREEATQMCLSQKEIPESAFFANMIRRIP